MHLEGPYLSTFHTISILAIGLLVVGCPVYIPPVEDLFDEIYDIDNIQAKVSTRSEVLDELGSPHYGDERSEIFLYEGKTSGGIVGVVVPIPMPTKSNPLQSGAIGTAERVNPESWWIAIYFDENDVVNRIETSSTPGYIGEGGSYGSLKTPVIREAATRIAQTTTEEALASEDPNSLWIAYKLDRKASAKTRWRLLCLAAHREQRVAQLELGRHYWDGIWPAQKDRAVGYMWYFMATRKVLTGQEHIRKFQSAYEENVWHDYFAYEDDDVLAHQLPGAREIRDEKFVRRQFKNSIERNASPQLVEEATLLAEDWGGDPEACVAKSENAETKINSEITEE